MSLWTPSQPVKGKEHLSHLDLTGLGNKLVTSLNQDNVQHTPLHQHVMHLSVPCYGAIFVSIHGVGSERVDTRFLVFH